MDISFWKNLQYNSGSNFAIDFSTKQYFKQYLYRLEITAHGCKSIRDEDIGKSLNKRRTYARDYNYGGSWWDAKIKENLDKADIGWLLELKNLIEEYPDVKVRTEEPKLSIYATDETMIQSFAKAISPDNRNNILSITGPKNNQVQQLLENNVILVKRAPKFRYRIFFKEKQFDFNVRQQIYTYLAQLGDLVKMTDHTKESLIKPHNWIWGCYFYSNDKGVAEMVRLIHPDVVREVSEIVCLDNK